MKKEEFVYMDLETTSLSARTGDIRLITYAIGNDTIIVKESLDDEIKQLLVNPNIGKVFHNAVFDVSFLRENGYEVNNIHCTLVMAKILNKEKISLKYLTKQELGIEMNKELQDSDNWKGEITESHIEYARKDVEYTRELYFKFQSQLKEQGLCEVYERERKVLKSITMLNLNGLRINYDEWNKILDVDRSEVVELKTQIQELLQSPNLNLQSPKQLVKAIDNYGIKLKSTSDEELAKYSDEHKVIKLLRKYRKKMIKIKTYGEKLREHIEDDGRIRGNWQLIGAKSGRMACSSPPIQALPTKCKSYITPEEGYKFIIADYSQIELRMLATISKDERLIQFFNKGIDLHCGTAGLVFNKNIDSVSKEERQVAKQLNFGIIYGITAYGIQKNLLKNGVNVTLEKAEEYRLKFLDSYPKVKALQNMLLMSNNIKTLGGRVWESNKLSLNQRLNFPIQGSSAEGLKEALILLSDNINTSWKLVAVVHDEIVLEVPEEDEDEAKKILVSSMILGMGKFIQEVSVKVDCSTDYKWVK